MIHFKPKTPLTEERRRDIKNKAILRRVSKMDLNYQEEHEGDNFPDYPKYEEDEHKHPDDPTR